MMDEQYEEDLSIIGEQLCSLNHRIRAVWIGIGVLVAVIGFTAIKSAKQADRIDKLAASQAQYDKQMHDLKGILAKERRADLHGVYERLNRLEGHTGSEPR